MPKVSFVYFDVGGVVILDFSKTNKWDELKRELGVTQDRITEFEELWGRYEDEICLTRGVDSLLPLIKHRFGSILPKSYSLLLNGFVNRFQVNKAIWPVIEKIHQKCGTGLLTNQYPRMLETIRGKGMLPDAIWDVVIDSSVEHIQKPDRKIFELGEMRTGYKRKEILFVENSPSHIEAADDFGWQSFLYDPLVPEKSSRELLKLCGTLCG